MTARTSIGTTISVKKIVSDAVIVTKRSQRTSAEETNATVQTVTTERTSAARRTGRRTALAILVTTCVETRSERSVGTLHAMMAKMRDERKGEKSAGVLAQMSRAATIDMTTGERRVKLLSLQSPP
jgi:hypothetical protein